MSKITIVDIAQNCGVSVKTVSRVLNNNTNVSEVTRQKVLSEMKKQGYQVNMLARGLKQNKTDILVVFIDTHQDEYMGVWHNLLLKYIFRYAKEKGYKVVVSPSNANEYLKDETDGFYLLSSRIADGAILLENVKKDKRVEYLQDKKIPYILVGETNQEDVHCVSLDNYAVGKQGAEYLIKRGHKHICFMVGEEKFLSVQLRIQGFNDAINMQNIKNTVVYGVNTTTKAYKEAKKSLEKGGIDAFFVSGDERAIGVYKAIAEKGLNIPTDIAVLGVDNIPLGEYLHPPISTMSQDFESMAKRCIDQIDRLISKEEIVDKKILLPTHVVERKST